MRLLFRLLFLSFLPLGLTDIPDGYNFWWTALGDSYASGVGSGNYTNGFRCLRYNQAYPVQMQGNNDLGLGTTPEDKRLFQNCVCSGAEVDDVANYQLLDNDQNSAPNWQYRNRARFGEPSVATLTIGGDDIDFPGILFNCILETHIPGAGPPFRTCDDQRAYTWSKINDPSLVTNISGLIGKVVTKAQQGQAGNKFKLYVTGYGQFFNNGTALCNNVTFARTANPKPDGKQHTNMTTAIRTEFNEMSLGLNAAIQKAVAQNAQNGVKYIDIDTPLTGHRFCEAGIQEPDQGNPNLWFWHYPYKAPDATEIGTTGPNYTSVLQAANAQVFGSESISQLSQQYSNAREVDDAFYNAIDSNQVAQLGGVNQTGLWDGIGNRTKVFHPQVPWHNWIQTAIVNQWKEDRDIDSTGASATQTGGPASPTPSTIPPRWSYTFHSYTANIQSGNFSFSVLPGRYNGNYGNSKRSLVERRRAVDQLSSIRSGKRSLIVREKASTEGSLDKRLCCDPPPPPPPPPPNTPGQVMVWTQSGSGASTHGPFNLSCTVDETEWQGFNPSDTGLPEYLEIQSGHACSFDSADKNLDGLHAKYGAQYMDVPTEVSAKQCVEHDNGVTCNSFTVS